MKSNASLSIRALILFKAEALLVFNCLMLSITKSLEIAFNVMVLVQLGRMSFKLFLRARKKHSASLFPILTENCRLKPISIDLQLTSLRVLKTICHGTLLRSLTNSSLLKVLKDRNSIIVGEE